MRGERKSPSAPTGFKRGGFSDARESCELFDTFLHARHRRKGESNPGDKGCPGQAATASAAGLLERETIFHFGRVRSSRPYLLRIACKVPSCSIWSSATFTRSSNSRFPFRTASADMGFGDADWYVSVTRVP